MGAGDVLTEEDEMNQLTIIDNLLYASTFGSSKCVIEEGAYSVIEDDGRYRVRIEQTTGESALMGILNYRLFRSRSVVESSCFYKEDGTVYVYAVYTSALENDAEQFLVKTFVNKKDDDDSQWLYLAKVTFVDGKPTIDTDVEKVYGKNILAHTADKTNPHGKTLIQDYINIQNDISVKGNHIFGAIYDDILSSGPNSETTYDIDSNFIPVFVNAYPNTLSIGVISWRIVDGKIRISNSGNSNEIIHLKIEVKPK